MFVSRLQGGLGYPSNGLAILGSGLCLVERKHCLRCEVFAACRDGVACYLGKRSMARNCHDLVWSAASFREPAARRLPQPMR